jgi:hypothetical protein
VDTLLDVRRRREVFEDGLHDTIRGVCPEGHERMPED